MKPDKTILLVRKFEPLDMFVRRFGLTAGEGEGEWHQAADSETLLRAEGPGNFFPDVILDFLHEHQIPYQLRNTYLEDKSTNYVTYFSELSSNMTDVYRVVEHPEKGRIYGELGPNQDVDEWAVTPPYLSERQQERVYLAELLFG